MNVARKEQIYTIDDIYALPEGERAELIDGQIYYMATPSMLHQRLVMEISYRIRVYIGEKKGDCEVFPSPFAVFLNSKKDIYLEPDISVICDKDKIASEGCMGAPDWIIEIASPTSRPIDYYKKLLKYSASGVREYWIVDVEKDRVTVYDFQWDTVEEYTFSDKVRAGIFDDFEIDFSEIKIK
ncbi:Uma2 family endonuclease [Lachnospiraceae bacterium WCA-9-b2]|jgi:Uma2 family endonuclease|uniref:Uma2 family endonuclease n=1 Tax=Sporofaciens musculi TaxID=2681861 RepID=A0A7X3MIA2_9FIRM|nr:Uma2 family endonuclease [Sporofaciens musculi]MCI8362952.1 Uma2 family endonuclease [Clostridia bacterium]MXP76911.1 Uma2 family endonuclease [Sporofaciens musculi]